MASGDIELVQGPPAILAGAINAWEAYQELSTDRQIGMSVGPIPFTALDRYAIRFGIEGEAFDTLRQLIRSLDEEFLGWQRDKSDTGGKRGLNG